MLILPLLGVTILWLTCIALGPALLLRGIRSRALPEAALGVSLLGAGAFGLPLQALSRLAAADHPGMAAVLAGSGLAAGTLGIVALCVFTWWVFRPESRLSRGICFGLCLLLLGSALAQVLISGLGANSEYHWIVLAVAERFIVLAWTALEAGAYHGRLRKRCRIGLAGPMLVNRFLLSTVAAAAACGICLVIGVMLVSGVLLRESALLGSTFALLSFASAGSLWLICAPLPVYTRFIEARAERASA